MDERHLPRELELIDIQVRRGGAGAGRSKRPVVSGPLKADRETGDVGRGVTTKYRLCYSCEHSRGAKGKLQMEAPVHSAHRPASCRAIKVGHM